MIERAAVIGASIEGALCAAVLSHRAVEVMVVDNIADGVVASVSGGLSNTAEHPWSLILGRGGLTVPQF